MNALSEIEHINSVGQKIKSQYTGGLFCSKQDLLQQGKKSCAEIERAFLDNAAGGNCGVNKRSLWKKHFTASHLLP